MARHKRNIDTKGEIVKAAWELFFTKGYNATPVSEILHKANLSKGTFYHYFESKEDLLDAVTERMAGVAVAEVRDASTKPDARAVDRLNRFFDASRQWRLAHKGFMLELMQVLYKDENTIIRHKMNRRNVALATPLLTEILSAGRAERVFDILDPEQTAQLLLTLSTGMAEKQAESLLALKEHPENLRLVMGRIEHLLLAVERILGLPDNTLDRPQQELVERFAGALHERM